MYGMKLGACEHYRRGYEGAWAGKKAACLMSMGVHCS